MDDPQQSRPELADKILEPVLEEVRAFRDALPADGSWPLPGTLEGLARICAAQNRAIDTLAHELVALTERVHQLETGPGMARLGL